VNTVEVGAVQALLHDTGPCIAVGLDLSRSKERLVGGERRPVEVERHTPAL
jgi:hypothetical protein